jgi:hypothetical protein
MVPVFRLAQTVETAVEVVPGIVGSLTVMVTRSDDAVHAPDDEMVHRKV